MLPIYRISAIIEEMSAYRKKEKAMIRNKALLTCAKKYCIDNYNYWVGVYCEETTEEDRKHGGEFIFP
jgi:hypothetical protein